MTNIALAKSYLQKAKVRLKMVELLLQEGAYSDVVREAQEAVELALKGMLRIIGVEPPKQHSEYTKQDAEKAYNDLKKVIEAAEKTILR